MSDAARAFGHARQVKDRIAGELMRIPGVVSVGVGTTAADEPCLIILTSFRAPDAPARLRQELDRLELDDVPVVTRKAGEFHAMRHATATQGYL